jgi:hypothetical protein
MRCNLEIDAYKTTHDIYTAISNTSSDKYCFDSTREADIAIVALEGGDITIEQRIMRHISRGQKTFVYYEHFGWFYTAPAADILNSPYLLGEITHSIDSLKRVKPLYPNIKHYYLPVGCPVQAAEVIKKRLYSDHPVTFLFWGSWGDFPHGNFTGRGGLAADEIFCRVRQEIPDAKLIIRTPMQLKCMELYPESVQAISDYVSIEELNRLHLISDIYLLPSIQAHFASIPIAMSWGLPVVGNNNWGWEENATDGYNSIRENYGTPGEHCMNRNALDYTYINTVAARLVELIRNRDKLITMSLNALDTQVKKHNVNDHPNRIDAILVDHFPT